MLDSSRAKHPETQSTEWTYLKYLEALVNL
jgi:hypothetical protein